MSLEPNGGTRRLLSPAGKINSKDSGVMHQRALPCRNAAIISGVGKSALQPYLVYVTPYFVFRQISWEDAEG